MWNESFMMKVFVIFCSMIYVTVRSELAPFIVPCHTSDMECLKSSAQQAVPILAAGVPSLNILPLDPLHVGHVKANQAGLRMDFKNTVVKGLRNCNVTKLRRLDRQTVINLKCSVILNGDYNLDGKLLILPIKGAGKYKIQIRDIAVNVVLDIGESMSAGNKYWTVKSWRHSANVLSGVKFKFQNLFDGNSELSNSIHKFANTNWRDIFEELAPPFVKAIVTSIVAETKKLFKQVPVDQLALD